MPIVLRDLLVATLLLAAAAGSLAWRHAAPEPAAPVAALAVAAP